MTRSSLSRPLSLSISYLAREPCGISMIAFTTRGEPSPTGTPCQGCETVIMSQTYSIPWDEKNLLLERMRLTLNMKPLLLIGAGGAIGSICRYLMTICVSKHMTIAFPMGTFLVNISGCFVIGLLFGLATRYAWLDADWRLFLITGICGGYTTFSSFSYESIQLIRQGD